jgi:hypothetical protein
LTAIKNTKKGGAAIDLNKKLSRASLRLMAISNFKVCSRYTITHDIHERKKNDERVDSQVRFICVKKQKPESISLKVI